MIELARHIEVLLLNNDCVILPGFGGFVTHYTPAKRDEEENIFLPPMRTIGFNEQLKLNDGLLVQSYMTTYDTSFSDASRIVEKQIDLLVEELYNEGKFSLPNVGELRLSMNHTYDFRPYNERIMTPSLYALDAFEIKTLKQLTQSIESQTTLTEHKREKEFTLLNHPIFRNAVAAAAAVAFFFLLSTPAENTDLLKENNHANVVPTQWIEELQKHAITLNPIVLKNNNPSKQEQEALPKETTKKETILTIEEDKTLTTPQIEVQQEPVQPTTTPTKQYHIIVASAIPLKDANLLSEELKAKGHHSAQVLSANNKVRVSIYSTSNKQEAYSKLSNLRANPAFENAWIFTK